MRTLIATSALIAGTLLAGTAMAQTGSGQFCLKGAAGDAKCNYQTMAQCEQAKGSGSGQQCIDRSQLQGTTGSGASSSGSMGSGVGGAEEGGSPGTSSPNLPRK